MPLPALPLHRVRPLLLGGRARRLLLWVLAGVGFLLLAVYQGGISVVGQPPSTTTLALVNLAVAAWAALLAFLLSDVFLRRAHNPIRALWVPLVVGILGTAAAAGLVSASGGAGPIAPRTGVPEGLGAAFQVSVLALIETLGAFVLLFSLRTLVLFKRTTGSVRNWWAMVAFMTLAALTLLGAGPLDVVNTNLVFVVTLVLAIVAMVLNAFRLAWIVYLPFRQKLAAIGLNLALIILIAYVFSHRSDPYDGVGVLVREDGALAGEPIDLMLTAVFSQPLAQFVTMVYGFGVLYATTALLSLLFHLPTAGALQQKTGEMEALQALARLSGEVFDRERLVDTVASAPVEAGVAQAAWLALIDPESGSLRPRLTAATGLTPVQIKALVDYQALADDALAQKQPILLRQAPADHRIRARPGDGIGSLLVLPLRAHNEAMGALFAVRSVADGYEEDDVEALRTFAGQAALALNNADLFAERIERERLERELAIAREVQQRLLPQRLPHHRSLALAALSLPAQEVAGDYYDFVDLGGGCYGVLVADVSGKGTSAAFYMAELKGIFQSVSKLTRSPAEFLARANEALAGSLGKNAFITALYGVLDTEAGTFTLARAGHCPVALAQENGTTQLIRSGGLGLGLDRGPLFRKALQERTLDLHPGDVFVLYTDGLVETRDRQGEEYGYERLQEAILRHRHRPPEALRDALLHDLRRFAGHDATDAPDDDLTLVVLKWSAATPALSGDGAEIATHTPAGGTATPTPA